MYFDDIKIQNVIHRFISGTKRENNLHAEVNSLEFIRCGYVLFFHDDGTRKETIRLNAPVFFWTRQGDDYAIIPDEESPRMKYVEHIYIDFTGPRTSRMVEALYELYPSGKMTPLEPEKIFETFRKILYLYRIDPVQNSAEIGVLLETLMFYVCSEKYNNKTDGYDHYKLETIADDIRSNPFKDYNFSATAKSLGITPDHFRRLFRGKHHLTPTAYLNHQRMIRAVELLEKTDMRIKEIVFTCHFSSVIGFSRSFKKYSGLSPREYRQKRNQ